MERRGSDLFSLVCVPVDEKADTQYDGVSDEQFASAASAADEGQMWFSGGGFHLFSIPIQHKDSQPRGGNEAKKLTPGAAVAFDVDLYGQLEIMGASRDGRIPNFNANPLQARATVEKVPSDYSVEVKVPGVFMHEYCEGITLLERGDGWWRANVESNRVVAHAAFRNAFLPTRLEQIQFDVALLHPEAVTLEEVSFADAKTGEALHALSSRTLRSLLDGETVLLVRGERMPVLDPTQVVLPWQENMKAMVLGYGGFFLNVCAAKAYPPFLISAAAFAWLGFAWPAIWKHLPGATQATFKRLPSAAARSRRLESSEFGVNKD